MTGQPPSTSPRNKRALERVVQKYADDHGIGVRRVMRWISFMVLTGALDRSRDTVDAPAFVVKGGFTLELRFGLRARATKDIDAAYRGAATAMLDALDDALAEPYEEFTFARVGDPAMIGTATQLHVRLAYRGVTWATAQLEISPSENSRAGHEYVRAIDLSAFGLAGPDRVACLPLPDQIAQKLHAMTQVWEPRDALGPARDNDRFRDLLDLYMLRDVIADHALLRDTRATCERLFAQRATHDWPPTITVYPSWPMPYARLADDNGVSVRDVFEAKVAVEAFIARIATAA